jgi:hypothetical protein
MKHVSISLTYDNEYYLLSVLESVVKNIKQGREKENYIENNIEVVFETFEIDTAKPERETRKERSPAAIVPKHSYQASRKSWNAAHRRLPKKEKIRARFQSSR